MFWDMFKCSVILYLCRSRSFDSIHSFCRPALAARAWRPTMSHPGPCPRTSPTPTPLGPPSSFLGCASQTQAAWPPSEFRPLGGVRGCLLHCSTRAPGPGGRTTRHRDGTQPKMRRSNHGSWSHHHNLLESLAPCPVVSTTSRGSWMSWDIIHCTIAKEVSSSSSRNGAVS